MALSVMGRGREKEDLCERKMWHERNGLGKVSKGQAV